MPQQELRQLIVGSTATCPCGEAAKVVECVPCALIRRLKPGLPTRLCGKQIPPRRAWEGSSLSTCPGRVKTLTQLESWLRLDPVESHLDCSPPRAMATETALKTGKIMFEDVAPILFLKGKRRLPPSSGSATSLSTNTKTTLPSNCGSFMSFSQSPLYIAGRESAA